MHVREMKRSDWEEVAQIYAQGIATGFATFEQKVPDYPVWDSAHTAKCRLVAVKENTILGWAALSQVSHRYVYRGIGEVSVYIDLENQGKGIGKQLMHQLIDKSEKEGFWTLQSSIFPENESSIALHKKVGFRYIGKRERVGKINNNWKDNLLFERRSKIIGIQ